MSNYKYVKIGILPREECQQRTIDIASGELKPSQDDPKVWFSSVESLEKALGFPIGSLIIETSEGD